MVPSQVTDEEFRQVLRDGMPIAADLSFEVATLERGRVVLRFTTRPIDLRPGETVAGPVLFEFADLAMYLMVMSVVGVVPLAVTTDATIHFLRRPRAGVLVVSARVIKDGQRLVVGDVLIANDGEEDAPVAHAVMTYSVPAKAR